MDGKRILFLPPPIEIVASVEHDFRSEGIRFSWVNDHQELLGELNRARPFLLVLDLSRLDASVFDVFPQIGTCAGDCKIITFGGDGDPQTLAVECSADTVFCPDVLDAPMLSAALERILRDGWEWFKRNSVSKSPYDLLFSNSREMEKIKAIIDQVAPTDITVLIQGETGTGKELVAQAIHLRSTRRTRPFIKVNCAAIPAEFLDRELFGCERDALAGEYTTKPGKFELANAGTILLKEIADLDDSLQTKLLRVLKERKVSRLDGKEGIALNTRIITSTKSDLRSAVKAGQFREDLYYRLNVASIPVPPLRKRRDEIPSLMQYFLNLYNFRYGRSYPGISKETEELLLRYDWPGNIRQLQNSIKRIVVSNDEGLVVREIFDKQGATLDTVAPASPHRHAVEEGRANLKDVGRRAAKEAEKAIIQRMLEQTRWNRRQTARLLKISYKALLYKIKEYGLDQ